MDGAGGTRVCHAVQPTSEDCGAPWQREGQVRVTGPVCVRRGLREHSGLTPFASELPAASLERSTSRSSTSCSTPSTTSTHGGAWCPVAQVLHADRGRVSRNAGALFLAPPGTSTACAWQLTGRFLTVAPLDTLVRWAALLNVMGSDNNVQPRLSVRHITPCLLCRLPSCARALPSASSAHPRADARCTPSAPSAGGLDAAVVDVAHAVFRRSSHVT